MQQDSTCARELHVNNGGGFRWAGASESDRSSGASAAEHNVGAAGTEDLRQQGIGVSRSASSRTRTDRAESEARIQKLEARISEFAAAQEETSQAADDIAPQAAAAALTARATSFRIEARILK